MITEILIFINSCLFLIPNLLDGNLDPGSQPGRFFTEVMSFGAQRTMAVENGEYYRLITAMFLHWNLTHFLLNMYSLWRIGKVMEITFGETRYLLIYFVSGLFGSLSTLFLASFFGESVNSASAGASGAIFGLVGALISFVYLHPNYFQNGVMQQLIGITVINVILGFSMKGIGNSAHIGGLVAGLIAGFIFSR